MDVMQLGSYLLLLGVGLALVIAGLSVVGLLVRSRRCIEASRAGFYALFVVIGGSSACLTYGFLAGTYNVEYVYNYSEKFLPPFFKLAGIWAGLAGSLLFWTFLVCAFAAITAYQQRRGAHEAAGRRLEPYVQIVLAAIALFFILVTWGEGPFETIPMERRLQLAQIHGVPIDESGNLLDGAGLNQQLVNYWFVVHPPTLYLGLVGWTIPFAFGIAGLLTNQLGSHWVRKVRIWSLVSWTFLTSGIILGGLWAYRQLGWGGYWAWDPVENASLLPWLTGTAFVHSILVTERRDLLKGWSVFLLILTFFLTIVATWMTRSGVVNSIHAFAGGPIGTWFALFLFALAGASLFILAFRLRTLRSTERIESLLSREAVFFLNNLVLVLIAVAVFVLSFLPKISHDWFASMRTDQDGGIYNRVITPLFVALLFLTALGPGLSWVRTTGSTLRRNFRGPVVATVVFLLLLYTFFHWQGAAGTWTEILVPRLAEQHPTALYPTGLILALSFLIFATVTADFARGVRGRMRNRGENPLVAFFRVSVRNNRRFGGYAVHLGLAILAAGIIVSSMFKVQEELILRIGESAKVGPYVVTPVSASFRDEPIPGEPYGKDEVVFRIAEAPEGALPVAHGETLGEAGRARAALPGGEPGPTVTELRPERRYYPKKNQWISEVTIHRRLFEDIYLYFKGRDTEGHVAFEVFLNPLMMFIYLGWLVMLGGSVFAALPLGRRASDGARHDRGAERPGSPATGRGGAGPLAAGRHPWQS